MEQTFDDWNILKKYLSEKTEAPFCNSREIWWCSVGMNIGTELYGKNDLFERPVLVLKVYSKESVFVLPLTSADKTGTYRFRLTWKTNISSAALSQGRTISTKRLSRKIGRISRKTFGEIRKAFIESL